MQGFDEGASAIPALQPVAPTVLQRHHLDTFAEALLRRRDQLQNSTMLIAHPLQVEAYGKMRKRPHSRGRRKNGRERRSLTV